MRIKNKKTYYLKRKTLIEDNEGGKYPGYLEKSIEIQAEIYGERLNYILNMLYDEDTEIVEGDGICVYVSKDNEPDYKVISIKRYSHLVIELEKIQK